ncbi:hypothetical protein QQX98_013348 [Neonectria punicea]|uniref:Uncharacterized protein n=1 Tax=Neonectria punicea TaxID=979145 RepID=A0ABR1GG44_9HYPO
MAVAFIRPFTISQHLRYHFFLLTLAAHIAAHRMLLGAARLGAASADPGPDNHPGDRVDIGPEDDHDDDVVPEWERLLTRELRAELDDSEGRLNAARTHFPAPPTFGENVHGGPVNYIIESRGFLHLKHRLDAHVGHRSLCCARGFRDFIALVDEVTAQLDTFAAVMQGIAGQGAGGSAGGQ